MTRMFATDVVGVSPAALQAIRSGSWKDDRRCFVVPDGVGLQRLCQDHATVDVRSALGASAEEAVILFLGRPDPQKRRRTIPPMVAALREQRVPARAVLVGPRDAKDDEAVLSAARNHRVEDRIHLWGPEENVGALLRQVDVLVQPSAYEGLSGVVLEAVAVGTPVVASDIAGMRFIAEHLGGVSYVRPGAPPLVWAEAIRRATAQKVTTEQREAAMARFRQSIFSLEAVAAQHLAMYGRGR